METISRTGIGFGFLPGPRILRVGVACAWLFSAVDGQAQRVSLAGEEAARALKESIATEAYNWSNGPVRLRTGAALHLGYTDNVFYSDQDRSEDFLINPEVSLSALCQITELNTLRLALGLGYEYYFNNSELNSDAPLINPDSELVFYVFVGGFRLRLRELVSYQETLFYSTSLGTAERLFNFIDVGKFSRWNNVAGLEVIGDFNKFVLTVTYDHENFIPTTSEFEYLERASEWAVVSGAFRLGDQVQAGLEAQASLHDYDQETELNDHWRARGGPFIEFTSPEKISLRAGGGYDTARFDRDAAANNDFEEYYAYARLRQETRLFAHSLTAGREHLLGDNANNMELTQIRYGISTPLIRHVDVWANASINFAEEFGGDFQEEFTFYRAAIGFACQFHKHWRTGLSYEFSLKDSDVPLRDFYRNSVTWDLAFSY